MTAITTARRLSLAPLVAAIALALLDHRLGLRSSIGGQRAADLDLFGRELALAAANVALVTLVGLDQLTRHPNLHVVDNINNCGERVGHGALLHGLPSQVA